MCGPTGRSEVLWGVHLSRCSSVNIDLAVGVVRIDIRCPVTHCTVRTYRTTNSLERFRVQILVLRFANLTGVFLKPSTLMPEWNDLLGYRSFRGFYSSLFNDHPGTRCSVLVVDDVLRPTINEWINKYPISSSDGATGVRQDRPSKPTVTCWQDQ